MAERSLANADDGEARIGHILDGSGTPTDGGGSSALFYLNLVTFVWLTSTLECNPDQFASARSQTPASIHPTRRRCV